MRHEYRDGDCHGTGDAEERVALRESPLKPRDEYSGMSFSREEKSMNVGGCGFLERLNIQVNNVLCGDIFTVVF